MKNKIIYILLTIFILVFIISGSLLIRDLYRSKKEDSANKELSKIVQEAQKEKEDIQEADNKEEEPIYAESGILYQYDKLWQKNHDMAGWLHIDGTNIDYPVMYTPKSPEYYLRRGFNKKYAFSGSLFLGEGWSEKGNYAVIYCHHMKDGTMFGPLYQYKAKKFASEHSIIRFDTLYTENEYEVLGAFYSKIYGINEKGVFRYYQYNDLSDPEVFNEFITQVKSYSLYDTGVTAEYGDKILTLSTCSYHTDNGRFVVVARKKRD